MRNNPHKNQKNNSKNIRYYILPTIKGIPLCEFKLGVQTCEGNHGTYRPLTPK